MLEFRQPPFRLSSTCCAFFISNLVGWFFSDVFSFKFVSCVSRCSRWCFFFSLPVHLICRPFFVPFNPFMVIIMPVHRSFYQSVRCSVRFSIRSLVGLCVFSSVLPFISSWAFFYPPILSSSCLCAYLLSFNRAVCALIFAPGRTAETPKQLISSTTMSTPSQYSPFFLRKRIPF